MDPSRGRRQRQIANGFHQALDASLLRQVQVLKVANGWNKVVQPFLTDHVAVMERCPPRHMVLVIDFDEDKERFDKVTQQIPLHLADRVYVLGAWSEPERLREGTSGDYSGRRTYEDVGCALAKDCRENTHATWGHELLRHNQSELDRLRTNVRPILFGSA